MNWARFVVLDLYYVLEADQKKSPIFSGWNQSFLKFLPPIRSHSIQINLKKKRWGKLLLNCIFFRIFCQVYFFRIRQKSIYSCCWCRGLTWPSISSIWHWGGNDLRFKNAFTHFFDVTHCTQWMGSMPQYRGKTISALIVCTFVNQRTFVY